MFYKIIKNFFLKKIVNKRLLNYELKPFEEKIKTIGVIIDEKYFSKKEELKETLKQNGFSVGVINVLIFSDRQKSKNIALETFYSQKDISVSGKVNKQEVVNFVEAPFDLLINYYGTARPSLTLISEMSKAKFKVGFAHVDNRINHFLITGEVENYKSFITELFKYLKVLNKI